MIRASEYSILNSCLTDKSMRVMVFCATDRHGTNDIAFPHQCEIKVNGGEVKANLRGLKNKPGSTRPVDVTDLLRLKPSNYENRVELTYALTQKVCEPISTAPLVQASPLTRTPCQYSRSTLDCSSARSCLSSNLPKRSRSGGKYPCPPSFKRVRRIQCNQAARPTAMLTFHSHKKGCRHRHRHHITGCLPQVPPLLHEAAGAM